WLLLPLLLIAALSFRKGWLLLIFLSLLLPPENVYAFSWDDLWQRPTQRAAKAFKEKDFAEAANLSKDPDWQAAALYRADKFKEAAAALEPLESSLSHYNRGNALAHSGELEKALAAYNKALDIDPDLEDARFNHALVEKLLQQQKEQEKQKSDKESDEQQKSDQDKKSDSSEKSDQQQESEEQQKSDQQQKDEGQKEGEQTSPEKEQPENSQSAENQDNNQESQPGEDAKSPSDKQSEKADSAKSSKEKADKGQENESEKQTAAAEESEEPLDAQQQALKQWLRRVPDDPGGLLKRKFLYQYRERENRSQGHKNW
ncbi:MAG: tetratricopeptide repeat protein, partial [Deltaproteobacteria bacterium]|nr:tetratricopeptide repeat protein [Deltaproteobacteria bacterium]